MKTWQKEIAVDKKVEKFTVGKDREFDLQLAAYDVYGSIAHAIMLGNCELVSPAEEKALLAELKNVLAEIETGVFSIGENAEDVHSQIELLLTGKLGDPGKKIHTARSRNDQSLLDIKLFIRGEIRKLAQRVTAVFEKWISLSEKHKGDLLPGYTHYQLAMPSSFGLWFAAYAESLSDDLELLLDRKS